MSTKVVTSGRLPRSATLLRSIRIAAAGAVVLLMASWPAAAQTWIQQFPTGTPPSQRADAGRAYDADNDRLILFGGWGYTGRPVDVWVLENASGAGATPHWIQLSPSGQPPHDREGHSVLYDPTTNRLIVYGGCFATCGYAMSDVWVLTNANGLGGTPEWMELSPPNGPGRAFQSAVYDPASNRMMIFGGNEAQFHTDQNDVWVLVDANGNGSPHWEHLSPAGTPPAPREMNAAFYDPASNRMVILGGGQFNAWFSDSTMFDDVWALTDANGVAGGTPQWIQLAPTGTRPQARCFHSAHYDPSTGRATIFGGVFDQRPAESVWFSDVWTLTDAAGVSDTPPHWTQLTPAGDTMSPRGNYSGGYSPTNNRMVVAMGRYDLATPGAFNDAAVFNDVWVLTDANGITNEAPIANAGADQTVVYAGPSGTAVTLNASESTDPDGDSLTYAWTGPFPEGGGTATVVNPTVTLPLGESTITLVVNDGTVDSPPDTVRVLVKYDSSGFFEPVDNLPTMNVARAGGAIPVKWSLGGYQGMDIVAPGYPVSGPIACDSAAGTDVVEQTVTAGSSSLNYDTVAGRYVYVWKTDKAWAGTCRQLVLKLKDGMFYRASFKFSR